MLAKMYISWKCKKIAPLKIWVSWIGLVYFPRDTLSILSVRAICNSLKVPRENSKVRNFIFYFLNWPWSISILTFMRSYFHLENTSEEVNCFLYIVHRSVYWNLLKSLDISWKELQKVMDLNFYLFILILNFLVCCLCPASPHSPTPGCARQSSQLEGRGDNMEPTPRGTSERNPKGLPSAICRGW